MNSKAPFESSKSGIEAGIFSASKNTIVQCPSCLTRYAVEAGSLSHSDTPRFHCSRCDHLFGAEDAGHFYTDSRQMPQYDLKGRKIPATEIKEVTVDLDSPSFRNAQKNRALQIPGSIAEEHRATPPHESLSNRPAEILTAEADEQINFDFEYRKNAQRSDKAELEKSFRGFSLKDASYGGQNLSPSDFGKVHYDFAGSESPWAAPAAEAHREPAEAAVFPPSSVPQPARQRSAWFPLAIFGAPLLATLCLLALFAAWISAGSSPQNPAASIVAPYLLQTSPVRLSIRDAGFHRVTLEDGTNVSVVSGSLSNNSGETLRNVTLEGFAFDSKGQQIISQRFPASDGLAKTRIKSLSLDMIRNIQSTGASPAVLKAGERLDFSLALLPENGDINTDKLLTRARYFGARVYSVNR